MYAANRVGSARRVRSDGAVALRWRRPDEPEPAAEGELDPDDARRLDADLAAFDR